MTLLTDSYGGTFMNEKFFSLPEEKQLAMINAGYRVFSRNSYKKSPMSEISAEAGISKSLLFHYFHNKKELYLFLLHNAAETTYTCLHEYKCYEGENIFHIMRRGLKAKVSLMRSQYKAFKNQSRLLCGRA